MQITHGCGSWGFDLGLDRPGRVGLLARPPPVPLTLKRWISLPLSADGTALLNLIGHLIAGPRHPMVLSTDAKTIETVGFLVEKGLAESTGFVRRVGGDGSFRVRLTVKDWMTFRGVAGVRGKP